ncbi:unnamed protein product [Dracunculus medinensis]|uniref:Erythroid differentiation-related factor 1 n=1 Tax=Dracunculus medinensis TaxID=318479 RepID=A0A0N4U3V2_DRAME|nr:unnamed protein product [Dracunculus medinensis]
MDSFFNRLKSLISPKKPLPVVRLEPNTNLNVPPLAAWVGQGNYSRGWRRASIKQRIDCFHFSIKLANKYIDAVGDVDLIAGADTLKKLLLLPFDSKQSLSLVLHKIGKTVLIDNSEHLHVSLANLINFLNFIAKFVGEGFPSIANFLSSESLKSIGASCAELRTDELIASLGEDMIVENLYSRSISIQSTGNDDLTNRDYETSNDSLDGNGNGQLELNIDENGLSDPLEHYNFPNFQDDCGKVEFDAFGRIWNFYDLNILVDVNLPIFGCKSNPCVTLHPKYVSVCFINGILEDMKHRPINFLTGVDLYLDQSMCNAPEALLCWHRSGYVKEYEVIRTEDIPHLENSKFDPSVLKNVAENIVSFLQENVAKEGHTYWLLHDKGDRENESMLRLWDLTPLCGDLLDDSTANPFTLSVGMLIYKVARNLMRRSAHKRPKRIANAAYRLLNVCLGIIDRNKHPQVIACVHYLLANLYLSYGHDAIKRSDDDEEEIERNEPMWAYDDQWQQEYGETYNNYAAISVESLKKKQMEDIRQKKPLKLRPLPNCSSTEDCCKQALEHCYEGLQSMILFHQLQKQNSDLKHVNVSLSFMKADNSSIDHGREEADIALATDVQSILFIRAATSYRTLANSSFVLGRYGRTLRFARVGTLCCRMWFFPTWLLLILVAVLSLNSGQITENARRNIATARSLLPAMLCHAAEAIGNIACSSLNSKIEAEVLLTFFKGRCFFKKIWKHMKFPRRHCVDLRRCYRDAQLESMARTCLRSVLVDIENEYGWMLLQTLSGQSHEQIEIAQRAANVAITLVKKIAPLSLFPPTASAIIFENELLRRIGNLKNCLGIQYTERLKTFVNRTTKLSVSHEKETLSQIFAVDLDLFGLDNSMPPEVLISQVVNSGKQLLEEGVGYFRLSGDQINESLLLSNIGQLHLLQFHAIVNSTHFSQEYNSDLEKQAAILAIEYYQSALTCASNLKQIAFPIFESISKDLASLYFSYASRLQDVQAKNKSDVAMEVREYLTRALYAYTLVRDSPKSSAKARNNASRYIIEINYRLGSLLHHSSVCFVYILEKFQLF